MKNTKQKLLILDIVENSCSHYSAEQIYIQARKTMSKISLGTVYRILNSLVDSGDIRRIKADDGVDHFDHNKDCHAHFICNKCDLIIDIENKHSFEKFVSENKVMSCEILYKGICKNCLEEEN